MGRSQVNVLKVGNVRIMLLKECHDTLWTGYSGWQRTLSLLKHGYYWPHMEDDVKEYTKDLLNVPTEQSGYIEIGRCSTTSINSK